MGHNDFGAYAAFSMKSRACAAAVAAVFALSAHALPTGGEVAAGSGSVATAGNVMTVTQTSRNVAIDWQGFNIGASETVKFVQPSSSAIALNRVLGANPSAIYGKLDANGQVWLINPNGILFGKSARIDTGGLVASTLDISDADFLAGKRAFSGNGGAIVNQGAIDAGYVALLGGQIANEGAIVARLGTVALAAGERITLDFSGDKLLNVQVDAGALKALADNRGLIRADGGTVVMTAKAKDALLDTAVNNSGVIQARSIENRTGKILLLGDMQSGTVKLDGTLDASAPNGGDGGFIETSAAKVGVGDTAVVTTKSANGKSGTWLIDPVDFTIAAAGGALTASGIGATTLSTSLGLGNVAIATDAGTAGNGDIFVNSAVSWSANKLTLTAHRNIAINANLNGSGTASLALEYGQGAVAAGNTSNYSLGNGAQVNLPAGNNFSTKLGSDGATTTWTVITALGAAGSVSGTDLQGMAGGLAGKYVLGADIDASTTNTWNAGAGFAPVGTDAASAFTGSFNGLGHTVTGLTINRAGTDFVGLFGYVNAGSTLSHVGLLNSSISGRSAVGTLAGLSSGAISYSYADGGSVTGNNSGNAAGGLVGSSPGSIDYSYANVSVTGANTGAGGLKGVGTGNVSNSYATGSVAGVINVGGLVGQQGAGTISNSYSTGTVTGTSFSGGLTGGKSSLEGVNANVSNSYWNTQTSGRATSYGGTGKTTAEMKQLATFTGGGWDIDDAGGTGKVWRIYDGNSYPLLRHYLTALTATAGSGSKIYDGSTSTTLGVTYSAAPNAHLLGTASAVAADANVGTWATRVAGAYSDQQGYDITFVDGTVTIDPVPLILLGITAANAAKTYGTAYSFTGTEFTPVGLQGGETIGSVTLTSTGAPASALAGSYAIVPSNAAGGTFNPANYDITYVNGTLTVNPAPLTVTANNAIKTYDGLAWSGNNGVSYNGFVNGEAADVLGGALVYGGNSQGAVGAGSYAITPGGLTAGNYAITFNNGTLTVNPAPLAVTANDVSRFYDGMAWSGGNGVTYSGLVNGETSAVLGGALVYGGTSQGAVDADSYIVTPSGLSSGNYTISYVSGALTVNKAPLTVTANDAARIYDGSAHQGGNGVRYAGFVNGETPAALGGALAWGGTAQGALVAGTYAIAPSGVVSNNYDIAFEDGTLTVSWPVAPTVAGAPVEGYAGAIIGTDPGSNPAKTKTIGPLLAAGDAPALPFSIEDCGQRLPLAIAGDCR